MSAQAEADHGLRAIVPPGGQEVGAHSPPAWGGCLRSSPPQGVQPEAGLEWAPDRSMDG